MNKRIKNILFNPYMPADLSADRPIAARIRQQILCSQESIEHGTNSVVRNNTISFNHRQVERHAPEFAPVMKVFVDWKYLGVGRKQRLRNRLEIIDKCQVKFRVAEVDIWVDKHRPLRGAQDVVLVCVSVNK